MTVRSLASVRRRHLYAVAPEHRVRHGARLASLAQAWPCRPSSRRLPLSAASRVYPYDRRGKEATPAEQVLEIVTPRTNAARLNSAERLFGSLVLHAAGRAEPVALEIVGDTERAPVPRPDGELVGTAARGWPARHGLPTGWTPSI